MFKNVTLYVNEDTFVLNVKPNKTLLEVLRDELGFTGTKEGCGTGECGACTVLLNGEPVASCLVLAPQADGAEILTVEGLLSEEGDIHPLQQAFLDAGAVQCGFCIPGTIMTSYRLLQEKANPERQEIREALAGNICRCTGYQKIIDAVELAAEKWQAGGEVQ